MQRREPVRRAREASLADRVHAELRDALISGRLRPNERMVEAELAERLNVSRTPLREGLARLASEGLIVSSRRGWVVREHTPDEVREIYEVRGALEGLAAGLAAVRATDAELDAIAAVHGGAAPELVQHPRAKLVDVNDAFHDAIADVAGNGRLDRLVAQNRRFFFNYRIAELFTEEEALASLRGHAAVLSALLARDAAAAEAAMRGHVQEALAVTLTKLR
jgi:DNA-binding GntR family transcriptional regulator